MASKGQDEHVIGCTVDPGVCCIKTYASKRKKELTFRGGWYVLEENYIMKIQVNVPTPKIRTHVSYVSKRNFLHNTPQV